MTDEQKKEGQPPCPGGAASPVPGASPAAGGSAAPAPPPGALRAIGYVRVSTAGQAEGGHSLVAQRERIEGWCVANGFELAGVYVDAGLSGGRADNRPALQQALGAACGGKAALVVYSLSRLARSTRDAIAISERLDRAGADLVSLSERIDTTSAAGKMVFRMLAVLAEFERDLVSERTVAVMGHLRDQNRRISRYLPFGFDLGADGQTLVPNAAEQEAIGHMRQLKKEGMSLRGIAAALQGMGVRGKRGGKWTAQAVKLVLERSAA